MKLISLFIAAVLLSWMAVAKAGEPEYIQKMDSPDKQIRMASIEAARRGLMTKVDVAKNREIPPTDLQYKKEIKVALLKRLDDADPEVQTAALEVLALVYGKEASDAEDKALALTKSKEGFVRAYSIFLLVEIGSKKDAVQQAVVKALDDPFYSVRSQATCGLVRTIPNLEKLVPKLTTLLMDEDSSVRENTIDALTHLDTLPAETIKALEKCTTDADELARTKASAALKKFKK